MYYSSPYFVHLRVGNLHVKVFVDCGICLYFHDFLGGKRRPQTDAKWHFPLPFTSSFSYKLLLLCSKESTKLSDSASPPVSTGAASLFALDRNSHAREWMLQLSGKEAKCAWWPHAAQPRDYSHALVLDTSAVTTKIPPLKKKMSSLNNCSSSHRAFTVNWKRCAPCLLFGKQLYFLQLPLSIYCSDRKLLHHWDCQCSWQRRFYSKDLGLK